VAIATAAPVGAATAKARHTKEDYFFIYSSTILYSLCVGTFGGGEGNKI